MTTTRPTPEQVRDEYMAGLEAQGLIAERRIEIARVWAGSPAHIVLRVEADIRDQFDDVDVQWDTDDMGRHYKVITGVRRHEPMVFRGRAA